MKEDLTALIRKVAVHLAATSLWFHLTKIVPGRGPSRKGMLVVHLREF